MLVTLRPEDAVDVAAKRSGTNVEYQTGSPPFDSSVYVDSPTVDAAVLQAVLCEEVRDAVLSLFALGMRSIQIDDASRDVVVSVTEFSTAAEVRDRADRVVAAFTRLVRNLPAVTPTGQEHAAPPLRGFLGLATAVAGVALFGTVPAFLLTAAAFDCTEPSSDGEGSTLKDGCGTAPLVGIAGGLVVGALVSTVALRMLGPSLRGRSDSSKRLVLLRGATFVSFAAITFVLLTTVVYALR